MDVKIVMHYEYGPGPTKVLGGEFEGVPCIIDGFEQYEFATHRTVNEHGVPNFQRWTVTELNTGYSIGNNAFSRSDAEAIAGSKLHGKGKRAFRKIWEDCPKIKGVY